MVSCRYQVTCVVRPGRDCRTQPTRTLPTAAELSRTLVSWSIVAAPDDFLTHISLSRRIQSRFVFHQSPPFFTFAILVFWQRLNTTRVCERTVFISNFLPVPVDFLSPAYSSICREGGSVCGPPTSNIAVIAHLSINTNTSNTHNQYHKIVWFLGVSLGVKANALRHTRLYSTGLRIGNDDRI